MPNNAKTIRQLKNEYSAAINTGVTAAPQRAAAALLPSPALRSEGDNGDRKIGAREAFAARDINDIRVRRGDRNCTDRLKGLRFKDRQQNAAGLHLYASAI